MPHIHVTHMQVLCAFITGLTQTRLYTLFQFALLLILCRWVLWFCICGDLKKRHITLMTKMGHTFVAIVHVPGDAIVVFFFYPFWALFRSQKMSHPDSRPFRVTWHQCADANLESQSLSQRCLVQSFVFFVHSNVCVVHVTVYYRRKVISQSLTATHARSHTHTPTRSSSLTLSHSLPHFSRSQSSMQSSRETEIRHEVHWW